MKQYLLKLSQYNLWANKRLGKTVLQAEPELLRKELVSSFPTLQKTIIHVWSAETTWLKRLQGESPDYWPGNNISDDITREDLVMQWLNRSSELSEYIEKMGDAYFGRTITYTDMKGATHSNPCSDMIIHCINHSTFHRGQLVTMLRNVGVRELPSTDYIRFVREELQSA